MSDHIVNFWQGEADRWNLQNKNPLVGWYDEHNNDPREEELLFRGIPTRVGSLALEYGCGPGRNFIKFKDLFKRIDGADISKNIIDKVSANLEGTGIPVPNLWHTDGHSLPLVSDSSYDVVYSIICQQHIGCRAWRLELYREFLRILAPGGHFTFQMGFGANGSAVDYFHEYDETDTHHRDVRVEDVEVLQKDLEDQGFIEFDHVLTDPCHDVHAQWIWVKCRKPL
jgi:SAM-dependent methyltransferase